MKEIKEQFVTYEIALKLKELGFDEECLAYYSKEAIYEDKDGNKTNFVLLSSKKMGELVGHGSVNNSLFKWLKENNKTSGELYTLSESVTAPLWQQVIDWLDKNHGLFIHFNKSYTCYNYQIYKYDNIEDCNDIIVDEFLADLYYEEAREQAILKAIELCQKK